MKLALTGLIAANNRCFMCCSAEDWAKKSKSKMKVPGILLDWDLSPEDIVKIGRDIIAKWKASTNVSQGKMNLLRNDFREANRSRA